MMCTRASSLLVKLVGRRYAGVARWLVDEVYESWVAMQDDCLWQPKTIFKVRKTNAIAGDASNKATAYMFEFSKTGTAGLHSARLAAG